MSVTERPIVEFCNVTKIFGNKTPIQNVSFAVNRNNLTTLIGPNGAGKTTIVRMMLGLEKPTSGRVIIDPSLSIGYVPQKFITDCNLPITVKEFLHLLAPGCFSDQIAKMANFLDLEKIKDQDVAALSGGQFQRLVLACSIINSPDLIILDEPIQSLDVAGQQEFYGIINNIRQKLDITIFMISHDLFTVMKNSDQVICLNGHVCCSGVPSQLVPASDFSAALSSLGFYAHRHDHSH